MLVDDGAIRAAQRRLWDVLRVVAEPGAAAPLAALLAGAYRPEPGERVGLVVSGANTTAVRFRTIRRTIRQPEPAVQRPMGGADDPVECGAPSPRFLWYLAQFVRI